jgi:hypothetical protein
VGGIFAAPGMPDIIGFMSSHEISAANGVSWRMGIVARRWREALELLREAGAGLHRSRHRGGRAGRRGDGRDPRPSWVVGARSPVPPTAATRHAERRPQGDRGATGGPLSFSAAAQPWGRPVSSSLTREERVPAVRFYAANARRSA